MTVLISYDLKKGKTPSDATRDERDIRRALMPFDVRFERWEANAPLAPGAGQDAVLAASWLAAVCWMMTGLFRTKGDSRGTPVNS